jgi:hypothetical protein
MKIKAKMEGTEFYSGRITLTPVTSPFSLAMSNTWRYEINPRTGDLVLNRNGLTIESNIKTVPTDAAKMNDDERGAMQMFCVLYFERYLSTRDEHAPTFETELEVDDHIGRYLLDPVLIAKFKPLVAQRTTLSAVVPPIGSAK